MLNCQPIIWSWCTSNTIVTIVGKILDKKIFLLLVMYVIVILFLNLKITAISVANMIYFFSMVMVQM